MSDIQSLSVSHCAWPQAMRMKKQIFSNISQPGRREKLLNKYFYLGGEMYYQKYLQCFKGRSSSIQRCWEASGKLNYALALKGWRLWECTAQRGNWPSPAPAAVLWNSSPNQAAMVPMTRPATAGKLRASLAQWLSEGYSEPFLDCQTSVYFPQTSSFSLLPLE